VTVKIYNNLGQIVRILYVSVNGKGQYQVLWDGLLSSGLPATSGQYFYIVDFGDGFLAGKMTLMK
jgi:flagellar hook assembly protein FlgD